MHSRSATQYAEDDGEDDVDGTDGDTSLNDPDYSPEPEPEPEETFPYDINLSDSCTTMEKYSPKEQTAASVPNIQLPKYFCSIVILLPLFYLFKVIRFTLGPNSQQKNLCYKLLLMFLYVILVNFKSF